MTEKEIETVLVKTAKNRLTILDFHKMQKLVMQPKQELKILKLMAKQLYREYLLTNLNN